MTFASVLGVTVKRNLSNREDFNNIGNVFGYYLSGCENTPDTLYNGFVVSFASDGIHGIQFAVSEKNSFSTLYIRTNWQSWSGWKSINLT